jgi:Protein of unknown function (DUF3716)
MSSSGPPAPLKRKRTALPALPTDRVSRSARAAAAADPTTYTTTQPAAPPAPPVSASDSDEYHPAEALPPTSKKTTGAITAFSQMRAARRADARTSKTLDLQRSSNREAYLAQCVGAVKTAPCKSCLKGQGPWQGCVVVAGFLKESCANCHYNGEGKRCSFRPGKFHPFFLIIFVFRMFFGYSYQKSTRKISETLNNS